MRLEKLEVAVGVHLRVARIEPGEQPDRRHVVLHAVNEPAAVGLGVVWIPHRMYDMAGLQFAFRQFPHFLYAGQIRLRVAPLRQIELFNQLFGEDSAGTFPEHDNFCEEIVARFEVRFLVAFLVQPPWSPVLTPTTLLSS